MLKIRPLFRTFTPYHFLKSGKGFTLIELLVVIAIIGMLASVILVAVDSARREGSTGAAQETMKSIQVAAHICLASHLAVTLPAADGNSAGSLCSGNVATYVALTPGWIYCDSSTGSQGAGNCGNEVSAQVTGVSFSIIAESHASGNIITCTQNLCTVTNEATPN